MQPLSRRTLLRNAGVALALPWLEAMAPASGAPARRAPFPCVLGAPRRLAFVYVPNGVHVPDWRPATEGTDYDLPWLLEPLAAHRESLLVLSGLTHDKARANGDGPGDHARACAAFLTAAQPFKSGDRIRAGVSADQVAAQRIGSATRFRSLEIGCEGGRQSGQCDSGYACVYSSNLAWSTPSTPVTKETDPRLVFDRLFLDGTVAGTPAQRAARLARRKSVLDFVRADARKLERRLGGRDRAKLDEYQSALREIERRVDRASGASAGDPVSLEARPAERPDGYEEHVQVMTELLALAFQTDVTRVATFMLANEGSNRSYPFLDVPEGHHSLSHHGKEPEKIEKIRRINRWQTERFAELLDRLAAVEEGDGTLLDHCMVVLGSGISDGNRHNHDDLPILVAGRGGGSLATGRHVVFPKETPAANLWLALLERVGAPTPALGDSTGVLPV